MIAQDHVPTYMFKSMPMHVQYRNDYFAKYAKKEISHSSNHRPVREHNSTAISCEHKHRDGNEASALHLLSEASWPTVGLQPAAQSRRRQRRSTGLGVTEQQMLPEVKRMLLSFTAAPSHICLLIKTQAYPSRLLHPAAIITLQLKIFSAARKNKQKRKISSGDAPCFGVCRKNQTHATSVPLTVFFFRCIFPLLNS